MDTLSIQELPNEVMLKIFSNLSVPDLHKRAAFVSKKWKNISRDSSLEPESVYVKETFIILSKAANVLEKFPNSVHSVTCCGLYYNFARVLEMIKNCENLKTFRLINCKLEEEEVTPEFLNMISDFPTNIKNLHLDFNNFSDVPSFRELFSRIPKSQVRKLRLVGNERIFFPIALTGLKELKVISKLGRVEASHIHPLIWDNKDTLKKLAIIGFSASPFTREIVQCKKLEKLTLCVDGVENYFQRVWDFSGANRVKLRLIRPPVDSLEYASIARRVESLFMEHWRAYRAEEYQILGNQFPALTKLQLNLHAILNATSDATHICDICEQIPRLEVLKLRNGDCRDASFVVSLMSRLKDFPNFRELRLVLDLPWKEAIQQEIWTGLRCQERSCDITSYQFINGAGKLECAYVISAR